MQSIDINSSSPDTLDALKNKIHQISGLDKNDRKVECIIIPNSKK
jgi:hypothetical protein